jgi:hypothetical protein
LNFVDTPTVPIPIALPLFGTGLAIMGWFGWRRKQHYDVFQIIRCDCWAGDDDCPEEPPFRLEYTGNNFTFADDPYTTDMSIS